MKKNVFRSTFLASLGVLAASLILILGVLFNYFSQQLSQELENEMTYVEQGLAAGGEAFLAGLLEEDSSTRVTLIDADGTVLFDTDASPSEMDNHSDREEVQEALETGSGESVRYSRTLSERTVYYAVLTEDSTVLRISATQITVLALIGSMLQPILMVVAVAVVLSGILSWYTSKRIVEPLNQVDLEHPLDADEVYDELAPFLTRIERQNRQIRKQMQELKEQQEEFDTITYQMDEGLIILDHKGNILSINRRGEEIFGVDQSCVGQHCIALGRSVKVINVLNQCLNGISAQEEFALKDREYSILATPVSVDDKKRGAVVLLLDITQSHQAEQLRREFTANVSHELKTPLTSISGYAELMQSGLVRQEDMIPFARKIYQEATRLIQLVQDILRLSQLDEGDTSVQQEPVELLNLSKQVVGRLEPTACQCGVRLEVKGYPCTISGYAQVLDEMVFNLVENAIKYNRPNGTVTVTVQEEDGCPVITVADTGIGIPPEHQSRVFERFYRVDKSHSKSTGGTGLGLSIVKHGAILHDAKLTLNSQVNVGTTIRIRFEA